MLHLNNPESLNSLTTNMAAEFTKELQQLRADSTMRALIVTGRVGRAGTCRQPKVLWLRMVGCIDAWFPKQQ